MWKPTLCREVWNFTNSGTWLVAGETNKHDSSWSPSAICSKASSSDRSCQVKGRRWTCFLQSSFWFLLPRVQKAGGGRGGPEAIAALLSRRASLCHAGRWTPWLRSFVQVNEVGLKKRVVCTGPVKGVLVRWLMFSHTRKFMLHDAFSDTLDDTPLATTREIWRSLTPRHEVRTPIEL